MTHDFGYIIYGSKKTFILYKLCVQEKIFILHTHVCIKK